MIFDEDLIEVYVNRCGFITEFILEHTVCGRRFEHLEGCLVSDEVLKCPFCLTLDKKEL